MKGHLRKMAFFYAEGEVRLTIELRAQTYQNNNAEFLLQPVFYSFGDNSSTIIKFVAYKKNMGYTSGYGKKY
jgi:putative salt-induced outer membrane protein YdiY